MVLCFASFIKVLKFCALPRVYNKTLCEAVVKTIDFYYGGILGSDDPKISRLMSCDKNLPPTEVVLPVRGADPVQIAKGMAEHLVPLIDPKKMKRAFLALQDLALQSTTEETVRFGRMRRGDLAIMSAFDPADFFADIFIYAAGYVDNDIGKGTIGLVTKAYVDSFEQYEGNVRIGTADVVEPQELQCTLSCDDFEAVFKKVNHGERLNVQNRSNINLYYLDISDSAFDYMALRDFLLDSVGLYAYNRTQIQEFIDKGKLRSMSARAIRLMNENGKPDERGTGNELGEMLLYAFMEGGLRAPKIMSKVEIATVGSYFKSHSDSVHLLKRTVNGQCSYQLVFGTSSIFSDVKGGIDHAFEALAAIKQGKVRERHMVDSTLMSHTYDDETKAKMTQILKPSKARQAEPDMAFGVFIGYSIDCPYDDNEVFRAEAVRKMQANIRDAIPYIEQKVAELNLGMHSYYFYFLPFNNAEQDKKMIMDDLLGGGRDE